MFRQQDFVGQKNVVGHAFDSFEIYDKLSMKDVTKHMTCNISVFSFVLYTYVCHAHSLHDCFSTFVQHAFLSSAIFIAKIHCKVLMLLFILQHDFKSCECCGVT